MKNNKAKSALKRSVNAIVALVAVFADRPPYFLAETSNTLLCLPFTGTLFVLS